MGTSASESETRTPLRRLALALVVLAAALSAFVYATRRTPSVVLAQTNSDHYSHVSAAALALAHGPRVYTGPIRDLCRQPQSRNDPTLQAIVAAARERRVAPMDVCLSAEAGYEVPLVVNWPAHPRPYPPGNLLWFAPIGLAYASGALGFAAACGLALASILLGAALASVALAWALGLFEDRGRRSREARWLLLAVYLVACLFLWGWSLAGFYDALALGPLFVAAGAWRRDRPALALAAFGLATFFHFRALWFLPLGLWALARAWPMLAGRRAPTHAGDRKWAGLGLGLGALSALSLALLSTQLGEFPPNHALHFPRMGEASAGQWAGLAGLFVTLGLAASLRPRARMMAGCAAWVLLMIMAAPQAMAWHAITLLPLVALAPPPEPGRPPLGSLAALVWIELAARTFFGATVWPGWIETLLGRLG